MDMVDILAAGKFSTLVTALQASGLEQTVRGEGPFTVFAPTDTVFEKLPAHTLDNLLQPVNKGKLAAILTHQIVSGRITEHDVADLDLATRLQGQTLKISKHGGMKVNGASVIVSDVEANNGVIHIIDTVLIPSFTLTRVGVNRRHYSVPANADEG